MFQRRRSKMVQELFQTNNFERSFKETRPSDGGIYLAYSCNENFNMILPFADIYADKAVERLFLKLSKIILHFKAYCYDGSWFPDLLPVCEPITTPATTTTTTTTKSTTTKTTTRIITVIKAKII